MRIGHSIKSLALAAGAVAAMWGMASTAQARDDVVWSVGIGSPGVHVGVTNAPQVVHARPVIVVPQPVYLHQPPVVVHPRHVIRHGQPVVVMAPRSYYYAQPAWVPPGHRPGWRGRHGDRWDHRDDHRGRGYDRGDHR